MKDCKNDNCFLKKLNQKCYKNCKSYIPSYDEKDAYLYYEALVLQSMYLSNLLENKYCGWNCNSGKSCDSCKENKMKKFNYWIKEAKCKLK